MSNLSKGHNQAFDHTPLKWRNLNEVLAQCNLCIMDPEKYEDAKQDKSWLKAMEDELFMIEKNGTWMLVDGPTEKPVIRVKWVYKAKLNLDGTVLKNKARLVAKDYAQKPSLDYNETYALVTRLDTIRTLIALAAQKSWKLYQLDVKSAFLNGVLQEEVYVEQPTGFVSTPGSCKSMLEEFKEDMKMNKFGLNEAKTITTLLVATEKLSKDDGSGFASEERYRSIVGSLLYLTATRPNIMYASSLLARFMHYPTNRHYGTAKRVLKYIKGSLDYGLEYVKGRKACLIGFCDSDWSGSLEDSKSTSGYAFSFGTEYISASEATTQAIWLRFVLEDFGETQTEATPLHCDNTFAIAITKNSMFHQKTKHIDRRYHFIKDALQKESLIWCIVPLKSR
ncbi:unnamed protein product [Prunus brigantina]